ncbi:hypothetical protein DFP72DRAFT_936737, partial [Ephemerocybe angulata]
MTLHPVILAARILARLPLCTSAMLAVMSASPLHPVRHALSLQYRRIACDADRPFYDETGCGKMDPGEFRGLLSRLTWARRSILDLVIVAARRHVDSPVV